MRTNRGRGRVAQRRRTTWATVQQTVSLAAANAYFTFDLLANFKADGGTQQAATVSRIRLRHTITSAVALGDNFALGIIRGQQSDVGASIAGAPTPDLQSYEDWMFWEWCFAAGPSAAQGGPVGFTEANGQTLIYDLRGARRLEELQMACNLVVKQLAATTFPVVHQFTGRVLLTLP